ncbi:MAG: cysteine desulfurase family protein [Bacteroidota bacterium]
MRVYLDNAATTPIHEDVIKAMAEAMQHNFGNPSSIHSEGRIARATVEAARKTVANLLGASIGEIFFTSGGTESNNMALKCAHRDLGVKRFLTTTSEHHCVLHSLQALQKEDEEVVVEYLTIDEKGRIDMAELEQKLQASTTKSMLSLMHSNNEIGTMIDLEAIAALCAEHGVYFHSDTVQTVGYFPINLSKTNISFLSGASHKFHGPKGVGFIYINNDNLIRPYIDGGSQERNMRGGTENIYGIVGLEKALEIACGGMAEHRQHMEGLRQYMKDQLQEHFEDVQINGNEDGQHHYKVLSVSFPPSPKSDLLLLNLDIAGISASGGSACSSGAEQGSHVLEALQLDPDRKTIRFSFSPYNSREEIDFVINKMKSMLPLKQLADKQS